MVNIDNFLADFFAISATAFIEKEKSEKNFDCKKQKDVSKQTAKIDGHEIPKPKYSKKTICYCCDIDDKVRNEIKKADIVKDGIPITLNEQMVFLSKKEKEKIIELIDKCFQIIKVQSDIDFERIKLYLCDILDILN